MSHSVNTDINNDKIRKCIFNFLYKYTEPQYDYSVISNLQTVRKFKHSNYVAFAKNKGIRVWLIFFKINENYYRVSFPCHYRDKQHTVEIFPLDAQFTKDFYEGSILEATFFKMDNKKLFVIDNVILLFGKQVNVYTRTHNLCEVSKILRNTRRNDNFEISVARLYKLERNELTNLYNYICENPNIESIVFVPDNSIRNKNYNYYIDSDDTNKEKLITTYSVFAMKKTGKPDVYLLYSKEDNEEIGIAYIPTKEISFLCKSWFTGKKDSVYAKCSKEGDKWIPCGLE